MAPRRPFVVDPVLTAISVGFNNPASFRIADQVLPKTPVSAEKFKWTEYPISEAFNVPDAKVGRRGRVQQLEFGGEERTAEVEDFGLETPIPYSDVEAAENARERGVSSYNPEAHSVEMLTDTIENIREVRVAGIVHNPATYAADKRVTLSGNSQFSDYTNSDPIGVIKTGMEGTLIYPPNTLVMGRQVWSKLSSHPKIVNAVKGNVTNAGVITREQFVELFSGEGITQLLVGDAWYNTARPGQNPALARAWGKHIGMLHLNPMAGVEGGGITFGVTAQYGGRISGRIEDMDVGLQGGVRIRTGERVKELVIAKDVGYFIQNAVA
ncbi:capsid protein [Sulfitobacter sp. KE29]|uniref:capsid protein n=1 Tax=unclassified Sulfitobacter TaxID=196795 RepID=UPI0023E22BA3|nr:MULTISPECIES: capsid protein [unclassified Sulfitobacter]MDF3420156.1 capsid protein [Sulfitobacter sp. Ks38]MDF3427641.1 capsid protein [Sulfitobacter sp. KE29]MDF3431220.1 capsid protein [Sulfitobacter sp. S46]MDF3445993.1 capsid protein [Sulfitobacter sp. KE31]MDF3550002.1 capsid protein [Sulfitobacter sp. KE28]